MTDTRGDCTLKPIKVSMGFEIHVATYQPSAKIAESVVGVCESGGETGELVANPEVLEAHKEQRGQRNPPSHFQQPPPSLRNAQI